MDSLDHARLSTKKQRSSRKPKKTSFKFLYNDISSVDVGTSNSHNYTNQECDPLGSSEKNLQKVKIKMNGIVHGVNAKSNLANVIDGEVSERPHILNSQQHLQKFNKVSF